MIHYAFSEGLTIATGTVHAFVAVVFFRFMHDRPQWGLGWLAVSYGLASFLNLAAGYTLSLTPQDAAFVPMQLTNLIVGVSCMGALTAGVRLYVGVTRPGPWAALAAVWMLYAMPISAKGLFTAEQLAFAGATLAAVIYIYLAAICVRAAQREPKVGHGVAAFMMAIYAPLVFGAYLIGLDSADLRYWSSLPYALAGLGLLSASMGRYKVELAELNASLESRVQVRTEELHDIIQGLESFNSMVSHDLRGPIGGVHGLSQFAVQALERGDTARALHLVQVIHTASSGLANLVHELLTLAKASQTDVHKQTTSLQCIVDQALQSVNVSRGEGSTAPVHCEGLGVQVQADPVLMRQVMVNLISNALKYASNVAQPDVRIGAQTKDAGLVVTVKDNGVGFDSTKQSDLFKPFKRLHTDGEFEGFGVGLAIVQRIVSGHGGRVWAESTPGQGAQFHVWLPEA